MHKEVLTTQQQELLHIVENFSKKGFYLAGGTALALQIGHRQSIDFDIFSQKQFDNQKILNNIKALNIQNKDLQVIIDQLDEYTLFINNIKLTFLRYPFEIKDIKQTKNISLASPITIGAMKAYALGRRGKWKDYIDLYILLQTYPLKKIVNKAKEIFGTSFSEKMFLQQICYFEDIDYTEKVIWLKKDHPTNNEVKSFLKEIAVKNA